MLPMPRYVACPSHGYRLCPVYDRDYWLRYAEAVGQTIRQQAAERELLLLWLGLVEATHRDPFTMAYLSDRIRLQDWSRRLIEQARHLAATCGAEALGR